MIIKKLLIAANFIDGYSLIEVDIIGRLRRDVDVILKVKGIGPKRLADVPLVKVNLVYIGIAICTQDG